MAVDLMKGAIGSTSFLAEPADMEIDLARSAWHDHVFAAWFMDFARQEVLVNSTRGADFFRECGEFAKKHKASFASTGDNVNALLKSQAAKNWFLTMDFPELPGGKDHKPTGWQIEKAGRYVNSRHDTLLIESLQDAEKIRQSGDLGRADKVAAEARRMFASFRGTSVPCKKAMSDLEGILALADSNPPLFKVDGELGRLINPRLKRDNLGVLMSSPKVGKTTSLVSLATIAGSQVPTLFFSSGDETSIKIDARIHTNLSTFVTQREFAGTYAVPVPDCAHNAAGTCPIDKGGEPRAVKCWKSLIDEGATPMELAEGTFDGSRTTGGNLYQPCCRCYPKNDGTPEDYKNRRRWKSAVWWRKETFELTNMQRLTDTRDRYEIDSFGGGLRVAAYPGGELTVDMINEKLDSLDRIEGFVPSVVVLDYADLLKQEEGRSSDKDHDGMRRIWEGLRAISFKRDILIITATQSNRSGGDIETHTVNTIGRCVKGADNCTWFATLNQVLSERRAKIMRLSMLFAREGGFDPEQQALCYQWHECQDSFAFSTPIFCKTKPEKERNN